MGPFWLEQSTSFHETVIDKKSMISNVTFCTDEVGARRREEKDRRGREWYYCYTNEQ